MALDMLLTSLAELTDDLERTPSLEEAARVVVAYAHEQFRVDHAGLSVHEPGAGVRRLAATGPVFARLDEVRTRLQEGPGAEPLADGAMVTVADTRVDDLWPQWCAAAAAEQIRSVRIIGLPSLRRRTVTLELFARQPHAFAPDDPIPAPAIKHAGLVLRYVDRIANLEDAVETRTLIGQAQGVVMERYSLTPEQAMSFLRRTSQDSQVKVRDLAAELIAPLQQTGERA